MHPLLRRLDLNLLLVFDALYRHRNVGTAASELAISASAFSHALGRLRQGLDDELFLRQGNRMQPTQRAEHLAAAVAAALRALGEGLEEWRPFVPGQSQRTFVFAATDYTAFALLPPLMNRLQHTGCWPAPACVAKWWCNCRRCWRRCSWQAPPISCSPLPDMPHRHWRKPPASPCIPRRSTFRPTCCGSTATSSMSGVTPMRG